MTKVGGSAPEFSFVSDIFIFCNVGSVAQCDGTSPSLVGRLLNILEMFLLVLLFYLLRFSRLSVEVCNYF
jgi:hypothetical protein